MHEHAPLTREEIDATLRRADLRATRQRAEVYGLLREVGGHRSVDELVELLDGRGVSIARATVYNAVSDLLDAGLLMCADAGPGRALYEAAEHWHHHFVCRVCGGVHDVPCVVGSKPCLEPPADLPGTVDEAQVIFRGVCHRCAAPSSEAPTQPAEHPTR